MLHVWGDVGYEGGNTLALAFGMRVRVWVTRDRVGGENLCYLVLRARESVGYEGECQQ
jgi:hypothetical protein